MSQTCLPAVFLPLGVEHVADDPVVFSAVVTLPSASPPGS